MTVMSRLRLAALAALMGATLTACDDTTGPGVFDPEMTAAAMSDMVAATDDMNEAWVGLSLAGGLFEGTAVAPYLPGGAPIAMDPAAARDFAVGLGSQALFPANFLGVTFVWSAEEESYVPSEETGAPEDGIRVMYYAVDPFTHQPENLDSPLGYLDLRDLSSASSDRLGVRIERTAGTAATLADYYIDMSFTATQQQLGFQQVARGYLSNGEGQLDFDLTAVATISETEVTYDQDYEISLAGTDARVTYDGFVSSDWEGGNQTLSIDALVRGSGTSVRFVVDADNESLAGEIYHGDQLVATISGSLDFPVFTNEATGEELTEAQLEALGDVFNALGVLFELAEAIFGGAQ